MAIDILGKLHSAAANNVLADAKEIAGGYMALTTEERTALNADKKVLGMLVYDTTLSKSFRWNGTIWEEDEAEVDTSNLATKDQLAAAKSELEAKISLISTFSVKVVDELPTSDISTTTIYLVPIDSTKTKYAQKYYDGDKAKWITLGSLDADLSEYLLKADAPELIRVQTIELLKNYYTKTETTNLIGRLTYSKEEVNKLLANKVEKDGTKVLSDNNFTNELKTKLDNQVNDPSAQFIEGVVLQFEDKTYETEKHVGYALINLDLLKNLFVTDTEFTTIYNELKSDISSVPKFKIEVVTELPTSDISTTTLYLVKATTGQSQNEYSEFIFVNNQWERLGSLGVDLSNYTTYADVEALIHQLGISSDDFYPKVAIDDKLAIVYRTLGEISLSNITAGVYDANNFLNYIFIVSNNDASKTTWLTTNKFYEGANIEVPNKTPVIRLNRTSGNNSTLYMLLSTYLNMYLKSEVYTKAETRNLVDERILKYENKQPVWTLDTTYSDYSYKGTIAITGVTTAMIADVVFSLNDANSGNYAPICETYNGGVYIYSKVNTSITIPTIMVVK